MHSIVRKTLCLLCSTLVLCMAGIAFAENKVFIKEYTYRASDMDSKVSSRMIALQEVKRALLEQLGTYLLSETEVRNFRMTKDQVTSITAGIVATEIIREQWDGTTYALQAKITVDPADVARRVKEIGDDRVKTRELEEARKRADDAMQEARRLREELDHVRTPQGRLDRQADYTRAIQEVGTDDWFSGYLFTMKDGGSFIWTQYYEAGAQYCMQQDVGTVCIQMSDVASIRKGEYSPHAEVVSSPPLNERDRRKAEHDRADSERANKKAACQARYDALQRARDSGNYQEQLASYRKDCSGVKVMQSDERARARHQEKQSVQPRAGKQGDMDRIIKNANDGAAF